MLIELNFWLNLPLFVLPYAATLVPTSRSDRAKRCFLFGHSSTVSPKWQSALPDPPSERRFREDPSEAWRSCLEPSAVLSELWTGFLLIRQDDFASRPFYVATCWFHPSRKLSKTISGLCDFLLECIHGCSLVAKVWYFSKCKVNLEQNIEYRKLLMYKRCIFSNYVHNYGV